MVDNFAMTLTQKLIKDYRKKDKKGKGKILGDYCRLTSISRSSAKQRFHRALGNILPQVLSVPLGKAKGRPKVYHSFHASLVKDLWELSGCICAERLYPMIPVYLDQLAKNQKLRTYSKEVIWEVRKISLATVKRTIAGFPFTSGKRKRKGNLAIFKQVPIEADFGNYTKHPGFIELDYIEHSGGNSSGLFAVTGTYVDLCSQWSVRAAGLGKSLISVKGIHEKAAKKIFHKILKYHPDNAPTVLQYLFTQAATGQHPHFTLSRSRPYKKNDNAHVEQKNDDKVRKLVGYYRFDTEEEVGLLNQLYDQADLYDNFFIPSAKLIKKEFNEKRKVARRVYGKPKTPYQRLLESKDVPKETKRKITTLYRSLNMLILRQKMDEIIDKLVTKKTLISVTKVLSDQGEEKHRFR